MCGGHPSSPIGIAYETLEAPDGSLSILAPMSAVAGNMAALVGAYDLGGSQGGKGVQLGQVLGKTYGKVLTSGTVSSRSMRLDQQQALGLLS